LNEKQQGGKRTMAKHYVKPYYRKVKGRKTRKGQRPLFQIRRGMILIILTLVVLVPFIPSLISLGYNILIQNKRRNRI